METDIDHMKYRKHTHLAGTDVREIIREKKTCEVTIKLAYYERGVNVNGKKQDNYFLRFEELDIEMIANSGNRKIITKIVMRERNISAVAAGILTTWVGMKINLLHNENVMFGRDKTGGIVVDEHYNQPIKLTFQQAKETFDIVNSRETFVAAMTKFSDFMGNPDILATCKDLAVKYPNPTAK